MQARVAQLILIRHGESVANAEARFTVGPHEPLTARGRAEADAAAHSLRERFRPAALYASPFARALETALRVGRQLALEPVVVEELREQHFGELAGRPYSDWSREASAPGPDRWHRRPSGGETLHEVLRRAGPALDAIARAHRGATPPSKGASGTTPGGRP